MFQDFVMELFNSKELVSLAIWCIIFIVLLVVVTVIYVQFMKKNLK